MKDLIYSFLILLIAATSCKKENNAGEINYTITYINSSNEFKSIRGNSYVMLNKNGADSLYTQFGTYITSLSPTVFTAKFGMIRFHTDKPLGASGDMENGGYQLELINNNLPEDAPERFADFINNNSVDVVPGLGGSLDEDRVFADDEINFIYLLILYEYLYQEVALPEQYSSITLDQFDNPNAIIEDNTLKAKSDILTKDIYTFEGYYNVAPHLIIFGNTDSTYASATEGNNPIWGNQGPVLRSNKYSTLVFHRPESSENFHITANLSFNSKNLIQIYAGQDNIPYTHDDIFIYAPIFWERFEVNVVTE
jgi:hypothetical protein